MTLLHVAYDDALLKWKLGDGHPTNPVRAKNAVELLQRRLGDECSVEPITRYVRESELEYVHDETYIRRTLGGWNDEWRGKRPDLGRTALHMFAGTAQLIDGVLDGRVTYGFSPQGAKHHAQYDHGSGFCVFNDMAWAAWRLTQEGHRVLYLDTDAHHGDGVENLTRHNTDVLTASVHDATIFPGTGHEHNDEFRVLNYPLEREAGDEALLASVDDALARAHEFAPTVVLYAIGGDGFVDDPLSSLTYSFRGYRLCAERIGQFVGERGLPIVMGGAGGYLPETATPRVWALVAKTVATVAKESVYTHPVV